MKLTIKDLMLYFGCSYSTAFRQLQIIKDVLEIPSHIKRISVFHLALYENIPYITMLSIIKDLRK